MGSEFALLFLSSRIFFGEPVPTSPDNALAAVESWTKRVA